MKFAAEYNGMNIIFLNVVCVYQGGNILLLAICYHYEYNIKLIKPFRKQLSLKFECSSKNAIAKECAC